MPKQRKFIDKPHEAHLHRALYFGQKSYYCQLCKEVGPWEYRQKHKCVDLKDTKEEY